MSIVPLEYQRWFHDIRERESAWIVAQMVGGARDVLNIGPSWGRDYYELTQLGKRVTNFDVAPQAHLPLIVGDVMGGLPFSAATFDAVIMAEVLEHLPYDVFALLEAGRVLRPNGRLVVTVPFYNDWAEFHVRIHSPASIRSLLACAGFQVVKYVERGGLISFPRLVHVFRRVASVLIEPERFNRAVTRFDLALSLRARWLLRRSSYYGCYLSARKGAVLDVQALNRKEFGHGRS